MGKIKKALLITTPASFTRGAVTQSDNRNLQMPAPPHTPFPRASRGPLQSDCVCARTCVFGCCLSPAARASRDLYCCDTLDNVCRERVSRDEEDTPVHMYTVQVEPGPCFSFFTSQTLHNRKLSKKNLGDLKPMIIFFIFDVQKFTWEIHMLKEVIRPPFTRANSKPTPSVRTQTTPSPARTQTIPSEPKGILITSYAKAFQFFFSG
jgi:hypothetical protein